MLAEAAEGRDLIKQMAARTEVQIRKSQRRLENLRTVNQAQEEYVKEKFGMDIGLMLTALIGSADPSIGPTYTLIAISAVALGGVSLAGGRGGMLGAAIGALDIFLLQSALTYFNFSTFILQIAYGSILVIAVVLAALQSRLLGRSPNGVR